MAVKGGQLTVQLLGAPYEAMRKVPMKQIQLMPTVIPASLVGINMENMKFEQARIPVRHRLLGNKKNVTIDNMMNMAQEQDMRKRDATGVPSITQIMCATIVCPDEILSQ
jgi:hypothetical protein